jgi:hypothetical protein
VNVTTNDETLHPIYYPKHTPQKGKTRNKMEGPTSEKTNEPPKKVSHKGNIKFLNPLQWGEAYQIRKIKRREDILKGCLG